MQIGMTPATGSGYRIAYIKVVIPPHEYPLGIHLSIPSARRTYDTAPAPVTRESKESTAEKGRAVQAT